MRLVPVRFLACVVAVTAATAMAQTPPPAAPPASPAPAAATPAASGTPAPAAATTPAAAPTNPRLAPGGIVAGGSTFPLNANITFDNAWSNAWLAPGYQRQPNWSTSIDARLAWRLPTADGALPRMILSARMQWFVNNWLPAFTNLDAYDRQVRYSDLGLSLIFPGLTKGLLNFGEWANFVATPIVAIRLPISAASRFSGLLVAPQAAVQFSWNSPEIGPFGTLFAQYTPVIRGNIYYRNAATRFAQGGVSTASNVSDPSAATVCRPEERVGDDCILAGRQLLGLFANNVAFGWNSPGDGAHNVSISLGTTHFFQRGLSTKPELNSIFSTAESYSVTSNGGISYTYTVPVDFQLFITTGVGSEQPMFMVGNAFGDTSPVFYVPRLPFWDFATPANGFSSAFFDVTVGF
jgi:hypothetical protein